MPELTEEEKEFLKELLPYRADFKEPLSEEELKVLRALILADARRQWIVSSLRGVSVWLAAIAGGYLALKGMLLDLVGLK